MNVPETWGFLGFLAGILVAIAGLSYAGYKIYIKALTKIWRKRDNAGSDDDHNIN